MTLSPSDAAAEDDVAIELPDTGVRLTKIESYQFNSHFLVPTDGWSITIGDPTHSEKLRAALVPGKRVRLVVNGQVSGAGKIDKRTITASRQGGTTIHVEGRDALAQAVDGHIDPQVRFSANQTLLDVLKGCFGPFGFDKESSFVADNEANRNIISGQSRGVKLTPKRHKPIKDYVVNQLKPYPREGAFGFASRVAQRFGLWIWLSADGETIIVSTPDFEQGARYQLRRLVDDPGRQNNVLDGTVHIDGSDQPSVIVATGYGAGADFGHTKLKVSIVNPAVVADVSAVLARHPDALAVEAPDADIVPLDEPSARPVFLHDDESKTLEQLSGFARRELALRMHKAFAASYTVQGHAANGCNWAVDTVVDLNDEIGDVHGPHWILSRTFAKSRHGGTTTHLEVVRRGSLSF